MIVITYPLRRDQMFAPDTGIRRYMKALGFENVGSGGGLGRRDIEFEGNRQAECLFDEYMDTHAAKICVAIGGPVEVEVVHNDDD